MDSRHALALLVGAAVAGPGVAQDQGPPADEIGPVIVTAERYVSKDGSSASSPISRWWRCRSQSASSRAT